MKTRHYFLLVAFLLAAHLTGCRASKPPEAQRPEPAGMPRNYVEAAITSPAIESKNRPAGLESASLSAGKSTQIATKAFFLSTPEGSARRQLRKDARAAVPRKLGKGAVYAPKATEVVNAFKNTAAVINADTGAIITAIGKNKASAATAPGATATTTTTKGLSWLWLLVPAAGLALWLYRKSIPFV